jgi:DNA repair exonuclease SbcCD ATPase subunit
MVDVDADFVLDYIREIKSSIASLKFEEEDQNSPKDIPKINQFGQFESALDTLQEHIGNQIKATIEAINQQKKLYDTHIKDHFFSSEVGDSKNLAIQTELQRVNDFLQQGNIEQASDTVSKLEEKLIALDAKYESSESKNVVESTRGCIEVLKKNLDLDNQLEKAKIIQRSYSRQQALYAVSEEIRSQLTTISPDSIKNKADFDKSQELLKELENQCVLQITESQNANIDAENARLGIEVNQKEALDALEAIAAKKEELNTRMKDIQRQAKTLIDNAQLELNTKMHNLTQETDKLDDTSTDTAAIIEGKLSKLAELERSFITIKQEAEAKNIELDQIAKDAGIENTFTLAPLEIVDGNNTNIETTKSLLTIELATKAQTELKAALTSLDEKINAINPNNLGTVESAIAKTAELNSETEKLKKLSDDYTEKAEAAGIQDQALNISVPQVFEKATAKQQDLDSRQKVIGGLLAEIDEAYRQFTLNTEELNNSLKRTTGQAFTSVDAINNQTLALQELLQNVKEAKGRTQQLLNTAQNSNIETNVSIDTAQIELKVAAQIKKLEQQTTTMQETAKQAITSANKDLNSKAQQLKEDVEDIPTDLNSVAEIKQTLISLQAAQKSASDLKNEANRSATELNFQAQNANIDDKIIIPDTTTLSQDIQSKVTALETKEKDIKQQASQAKQTLDEAVSALNQIPVESLSSLQQIREEKTKLVTANQALDDYTKKAGLAHNPENTEGISSIIEGISSIIKKRDKSLDAQSEQIKKAAADAKQILDAAVQGINTKINAIKPDTLKIDDVKSKTDELNGDSSKLQELLRDYTQKAEAAEVDPKAESEAVTQTLGGISLKQKAIFTQKISLELSAHGAQSNLDKAIKELKQIAGQSVEGLKVDGLEQQIRKITQAQQNVTDSVKNCKAVSESTGIPIDTSKANPSEADKIKEKIQASIQTIKEAASQKVTAHQAALNRLKTPLGQTNEPFTTAQEIKDEQDRLEQLIAKTKLAIENAEKINIEARDAKIDGVKTQPVTEALIAAQTKLDGLKPQSDQITKAAVEAQDKLNKALASLNQKIAEIKSNKSSDIPTYEKLRNELSECSKQLESAQNEFKSKADATKISGTININFVSSMSSASSAQNEAKKILENLSQRITTINAIYDAQKKLNQDIENNLKRIPEQDTFSRLTNVTEIQSQLVELENLKKDIIALEDKAKLTNEQLNEKASGAGIQNTFDMSSFEFIQANIEISSKMLNDKKGAFIAQALTAVKDLDKKVADINQVIKVLPDPITESNQIIQAKEQLSSLEKKVKEQFTEFEKLTIPAVGDEATTKKIDTSKANYSSAIANLEQTIQSLEQKELDIQAKASASLKTLNSKITDSQELIAKIENLSDPKHAKIDKLTLKNYLKDLQELSRELPKMLSSAENDAKNANQPSLDDQAKMVADFKSKISNYEIIINQQLKILQLREQLSTTQAFQQQNSPTINPLNSNTQPIVNSAETISQSPFKGFNIFSRYKEQLDTQIEQNTPLASINFQERVDLKELELFKKEGGVTLTVPTTNHTFQFRHDGKHDAQAILTREGAGIGKEPIAALKDEQRQKIGLDVINMIENVLAKGNNLHFKTSDPYVAEFAKQYVDDLKKQELTINASIEGPKTQQPANTDVAKKASEDFNKIKTQFSYDNNFHNREWVKEHKESAQKIQENAQKASPSSP